MNGSRPTVHKQEIVLQNKWYKVRKDTLTWPNGTPGEYNVVEFPGAVIMICLKDDQILTVKQFRYPTQEYSLELVGGGMQSGKSPLETAMAELKEEAGYIANSWELLGNFYALKGVCNMKMHVFLARNLQPTEQALEDSEHDLSVEWMSITRWEQQIADGTVTDGEAMAAWCLYQTKLNQKKA